MAQRRTQASLLSFFGSSSSKKLKLEDDVNSPSSFPPATDDSSPTAQPETSTNKSLNQTAVGIEIPSTSANPPQPLVNEYLINERDPCHGPTFAKGFINLGPYQPKCDEYPVTKGRKFRSEWYRTYPWLEYSSQKNKAFCFVCRVNCDIKLSKSESSFTLDGFDNWKKATDKFESHKNSQVHLTNTAKLHSLKQSEVSGSVAAQLDKQYSKEVQENREYLKTICQSLIFCGRQSIALRGHNESEDSNNKGNFLELMTLRAKDSPLIKRCFMEKEKHFQYTTGKFQNELLSIIGDEIKSQITGKIKSCKIFSLIADETQDIARHEQVAVVFRYVDDNLFVNESFLGFYRTENTDGESLTTLLKSILTSLDLEIENVRAQCYDGAANMRGPYKGVAARLLNENPLAMYIHCHAHILNLCIVSGCTGVQAIRNTLFVLQSLYNFIEKSAKRHAVFERIRKNSTNFHGGPTKLKSLSDTRWNCRVESVNAILDNFEVTIATLREISENDTSHGGEANSLIQSVERFEFIFCLLLLRRVLTQCDILSKALQAQKVNYTVVNDLVKSTTSILSSFRSDEFFQQLWSHCSRIVDSCSFKPAALPRKMKIPNRLGGGTKDPTETVDAHYKVTVLNPVLDILIGEINGRLEENNVKILNTLCNVITVDNLRENDVHDLCQHYSMDDDTLLAELKCFYPMVIGKDLEERCEVLTKRNLKDIFPTTFELFRLYLTIPMSSAACERSFSCLRRLKTYLRNTTGQERLSSLALLAIQRDENVDIEKVINKFTTTKRRLNFV